MKTWISLNLSLAAALMLAACAPATDTNKISSNASSSDRILGGSVVLANDPIAKSIVGLVLFTEQPLIVNGRPVIRNGQPVMVDGQAGCTGVLITTNVVLTAAHCVTGVKRIIAYFGNTIDEVANDTTKLRAATRIVLHRGYNLDQEKDSHDIALIQLHAAAPAGFVPATLMSSATALRNGASVTLAGYGVSAMTSVEESSGGDVLRKIQMTIENATFSPTEILFNQTNGSGACHGDSGGPAYMVNNGSAVVFGITSRVYEADQSEVAQSEAVTCRRHAIYTNVVSYLNWIRTTAIPGLRTMTNGQRKAL